MPRSPPTLDNRTGFKLFIEARSAICSIPSFVGCNANNPAFDFCLAANCAHVRGASA